MPATTAQLRIGSDSAFDRAAARLQQRLLTATGGGALSKVTSALSGERWFGHPLHPAVVVIPAGAWLISALYDARSERTNAVADQNVADLTLKVGVVAAVPAALTGVAQFLRTDGEARRVAALHWSMNAGAVTLYATSWVLRGKGYRRGGRRLSLAALALVGPGAYLGGHLVYRLGVGTQLD